MWAYEEARNMRASSQMAVTQTEALCTVGFNSIVVEEYAKMRSQSQAERLWFDWMKEELLRHGCIA